MVIHTEHKTVQAHIVDCVQEMVWTLVSRADAGVRRGFDKLQIKPADYAKPPTRSSLKHCSIEGRR
jgi:hypothetical protein